MIRDWLSPLRTASLALNVPTYQPQLSAWTDNSHLDTITPASWPWFDLLGADVPLPLTRAEAMMVPAVARARHLICGTIARLPLLALRGDDEVTPQPYWMFGSDGQLGDLPDEQRVRLGLYTPQSAFQRMLDTADDLLFCGWSLWLVTRFAAADPVTGRRFPIRMVHLPFGSWDVDSDGHLIDADAQPIDAGAAVLFQGMHEGILSFAARTIRSAGRLETVAADVAQRPLRFELHQTSDIELTPDERRGLVDETRKALSTNDGVLFTNSAIETKTYNVNSDSELLIGGRNAAALDVARHMNIPGAMIDATTTGASLEYQTTQTRNQQWLDYGLTGYMDPITTRLSMDDVLPAGQRAAFDTESLTTSLAPTTGPAVED